MAPPRKYRQNASGRAFEALLEQAGFSQGEAAEALGIDLRTVRRYVGGDDIPEPTIRLMRAFARNLIDDVEQIL